MSNTNSDAIFLHAFNLLPQIGTRRLTKILRHFKSGKTAWNSDKTAWDSINLEAPIIQSILEHRGKIDIDKETKSLAGHKISLLTWFDVEYPELLKEIADPPPLLYYRGTLLPKDSLNVAVVGTRKITGYGKIVTPMLARPLAQNGCVIVSGLAFGVDRASHVAAINAQGKTIAVLASGLDEASLYPKEHGLLAQQIIEGNGCLLSEHPPGTAALKGNFVARNRIVSGLSSATVVVECGTQSGALITARFALEQNRLVFAVPGPITSQMSEGPNRLIAQGARPLLDANEILSELNLSTISNSINTGTAALPSLSKHEHIVLQFLSNEAMYPDELVDECGLSAGQVATALGILELKGIVRNLGANQYVRSV